MTKSATILFTCTPQFKDALGVYAQQHKLSSSEVIREAVARMIKYDFDKEENTDKRRKYNSAEERQEAQRKKQQEERAEVRKLLEVLGKEQRLRDALGIERSLKAKGIDLDDE